MLQKYFTIPLSKGDFKWWFIIISIVISGLYLVLTSTDSKFFTTISVILIPVLLGIKIGKSKLRNSLHDALKNTKKGFGLELNHPLKIGIYTLLGFFTFIIAVFIFKSLSQEGSDASAQVIKSLGFGQNIWRDLTLVTTVCIGAAIAEELMYRGLFFKSIWDSGLSIKKSFKYKKMIVFLVASTITSYLFMSIHGGDGQDAQMLMLFLLGFIASILYVMTGSIYAPILFHAMNNSYALSVGISQAGVQLSHPALYALIIISPILVFLITFGIQKGFDIGAHTLKK